jgi:ubiquinone/menaquinone biosynthesis C-methylase UbiE
VIRGEAEIRDAYRSTTVARNYLQERFREPLGALLHARQVRAVAEAIERARPERILELAPGPARVTRDVAARVNRRWTIMDASAQMLEQARARLDGGVGWNLVQGDAFALPLDQSFDLVYTFRLIRHFELSERRRLYAQITRVLRKGGILVFDAVNERVSAPIRATAPDEFAHFDALVTSAQLQAELTEAGLEVVGLQGVQHRFPLLHKLQTFVSPRSRVVARAAMEVIDALPGGEPLEWIVTCRRT